MVHQPKVSNHPQETTFITLRI